MKYKTDNILIKKIIINVMQNDSKTSKKGVKKMKKRKEILDKYKWDFSEYFANDKAWEEEFEVYSKKILDIEKFNGKLTNKKEILSCFEFLESLNLMAEPLYIYANCQKDVEVSNANYQKLLNKIEGKLTEQSVASSFITPQISKLKDKFLLKLLKDKDFKKYEKLLKDIIREKPHTLSEQEEKLLSGVTSFSRDFDSNFSNFEDGDLKFPNILNKAKKSMPLTQSLYSAYMRDSDEVLRENAYIELHSTFGKFNNFLTSNYLASVKKDVFFAKNRNFSSALNRALFHEEVSSEVYNNLTKRVGENLKLEHKYFALKQKILNLKTFKLSDVYYNPLKSTKKWTYEEGFNLVCTALSLLGEDYINEIKTLNDTRKIDVFPNEDKHNGAYKTGAYGKPPLVLTNFNGNFDDISTLAHELGHAMHSVYSDRTQSLFSADYTIFLAEIASTVNETLLNNYMSEHATQKQEKMFYINEFVSRFHATVFRQTMFADFEEKIHTMVEENAPLSSEVLNATYLDLVKKYFGKGVKIFDCVKYEWSRIPHFYTAFYVYKYATGLISAINIVENLKSGAITVDDYKKFLSLGCSLDPISALKTVKVDLSTEEPFTKAFNVLEKYLKDLEQLIAKK